MSKTLHFNVSFSGSIVFTEEYLDGINKAVEHSKSMDPADIEPLVKSLLNILETEGQEKMLQVVTRTLLRGSIKEELKDSGCKLSPAKVTFIPHD